MKTLYCIKPHISPIYYYWPRFSYGGSLELQSERSPVMLATGQICAQCRLVAKLCKTSLNSSWLVLNALKIDLECVWRWNISPWMSAHPGICLDVKQSRRSGILGGGTALSLTSEERDETNGHFMGLSGIKPQWPMCVLELCVLWCWRAATSLICSTYCGLDYKWSSKLPPKTWHSCSFPKQ